MDATGGDDQEDQNLLTLGSCGIWRPALVYQGCLLVFAGVVRSHAVSSLFTTSHRSFEISPMIRDGEKERICLS